MNLQARRHAPIVPEPVNLDADHPGYAPGHWDYPRRCADVEAALTAARERVEEWDREQDAHGWWHERPHWIALYNEVLRLRAAERGTWEPGRWWRVVDPAGGVWCETSSEQEARESMRPGDELFRWWQLTASEWRPADQPKQT